MGGREVNKIILDCDSVLLARDAQQRHLWLGSSLSVWRVKLKIGATELLKNAKGGTQPGG